VTFPVNAKGVRDLFSVVEPLDVFIENSKNSNVRNAVQRWESGFIIAIEIFEIIAPTICKAFVWFVTLDCTVKTKSAVESGPISLVRSAGIPPPRVSFVGSITRDS
jgi:hypothetical protein